MRRILALFPPGRPGRLLQRRSSNYLMSVREGVDECRDRMWGRTLTDYQRECAANSSPARVLCTSDFTPVGPRRVCPRRILDLVNPDGSIHRRLEPRERTRYRRER